MTKRIYKRRSEADRIAELESRIETLQKKIQSRERADLPVLREIPKIQRKLKVFAQTAVNYGREDLANSTMAFVMGLERHLDDAGISRRVPRKVERDGDEE
jgi:hypothetical protein